MKPQKTLFDLHECYSSINSTGKKINKVVSTISYNLPYAIQRRKSQVLSTLNMYPKGTFFVITENGKRPKIN
jgi:hypothetical protein